MQIEWNNSKRSTACSTATENGRRANKIEEGRIGFRNRVLLQLNDRQETFRCNLAFNAA